MEKNNILVMVPIDHLKRTCEILEGIGPVIYLDHPTREDIYPLLPGVVAIFANMKMMLDKDIIDRAHRLKVIATPSTGTDHIDKECCSQRGIVVQSLTKDFDVLEKITSTAEHAFALTLNVVRNLPWSFDSVRRGEWDYTKFKGRELHGRIVGIVGYGRLGKMFSRFAHGFDMQVVAYDPYVKITDPWAEQVDLDRLLSKSEIISLHVHLTKKTRRMVNQSWFDKMNGVYFINTSRGGLVDELALKEALESGRVKAAGLDVLDGEIEGNINGHPLVQYARTHQNVLITPHCGGNSYDGQEKAFTHAAKKLAQFLENRSQ